MNAIPAKFLFAAAAIAVALGASITRADEQPAVYGRAGYPVAEERIKQLTQAPIRDTGRDSQTVVWYGRAGYAVGPDSVRTTVPAPKVYAAGQTREATVYGRAGVPLPFPY